MSFTFNWPRFSDQFHYDAIQMLNTALNKGNKPPIIADKIEVVELEMGTQPPELEIRDIGDLTVDQFRGIFRLTYSGDAHLVLKTKVQANPLNHKQPDIHLMAGSRGMLAAKHPLVVPMLLRLSHFKLSSYVVLVVSKQKGITLVFKTDPLQNVDINSTFDSIAVIQNFIQREIEGQLRQMFREDLPGIIHRLSQQWVKAKVEAPYLNNRPPPSTRRMFDTSSAPGSLPHLEAGPRHRLQKKSSYTSLGSRRPRSSGPVSVADSENPTSIPPIPSPTADSQGDLDNFDPTYGLRPEGVPVKSGFKGFSALFTQNKGLADLAEEIEEGSEIDEYEDEGTSYDVVDWDDTFHNPTPPQSVYNDKDNTPEYETIPAVGGGTITRPRIYHSQSAVQNHIPAPSLSKSLSSLPLHRSYSQNIGILRSGAVTPSSFTSRYPLPASNPYFPEYVAGPSKITGQSLRSHNIPLSSSYSYTSTRPMTPDSLETHSQPSHSSSGGPPTQRKSSLSTNTTRSANDFDADETDSQIFMRPPPSERRLSMSSSVTLDVRSSSPQSVVDSGNHLSHDPKIILRPSLNNNSIHQLSTLSHSNHTLSPYTRDLSHFTVRSVPPRSLGTTGSLFAGMGGERPVPKARRKRTYRLGGKNGPSGPHSPPHSTMPTPPSSSSPNLPSRHEPRNAGTPTPYPVIPSLHLPSPHHRQHQQNKSSKSLGSAPPSEFDASDMDRYFRMHDPPTDMYLPASSVSVSPDQTVRPSPFRARKSLPPYVNTSGPS